MLLRREGRPVNRKRVRRLYRLQGLQLRMRVRRRKQMFKTGPSSDPVTRRATRRPLWPAGSTRARVPSRTFRRARQVCQPTPCELVATGFPPALLP